MRHRDFPRRRPPWWPESEPWPPQGEPPFGSMHRRPGYFFARIAAFLLVLFCAAFGVFTFLFWWVYSFFNSGAPQRGPFGVLGAREFLLLVLGFAILLFALRGLRRLALPLGDLVDAAGRVAEGDYAVRVPERGPRELRSLAHAFNSMAARLESNAQQRRNLLADVTHELRTPLTVIRGNVEGLADGIYPPDKAHLQAVLEETQVLSRLIDDLRTLALTESGALVLQKEPTDLAALIGETATSFRPQAEAAGVELRVESEPGLAPISIDAQRVREVLTNLISNALRYTPAGNKVLVRYSQEEGNAKRAVIAVSDTGAGISADELPHIFDRFYKSADSRGSGLGLAIARGLVAAHGGEMTAESRPGEGTTIRFTLPIGQ